MKKTRWKILSVIAVMALMLAGCDVFTPTASPTPLPTPETVSGVIAAGNLVPADSINLSYAMSGIVADILVHEGERVEKGVAIARLRDVQAPEAQILAAKASALQAQQNLDELNKNANLAHDQAVIQLVQAKQALVAAEKAWDTVDTEDFQTELDDAQIEMTDAKDDLDEAQADFDEYQDLDEDNTTRQYYQDALDEAQQAYDEARWAYEDLQYRYDLAQAQLTAAQDTLTTAQQDVEDTANGPDPDALALAQANLDQANRQLDAAEAALGYVELTAPFSGKIVRMALTEGAPTAPGELAAVLVDDSQWYVETNDLTEDEVVQVKVGQAVTVTFDALPGQSFDGEVEKISDYALERYGDVTYMVRIRLLEGDDLLRWGMTAEVTFPE
jgi:HlyD family secretion protein